MRTRVSSTGLGLWALGSGYWALGDGRWAAIGSGLWAERGSRPWALGPRYGRFSDGGSTIDAGRSTPDAGRSTTDDGRSTIDDSGGRTCSPTPTITSTTAAQAPRKSALFTKLGGGTSSRTAFRTRVVNSSDGSTSNSA